MRTSRHERGEARREHRKTLASGSVTGSRSVNGDRFSTLNSGIGIGAKLAKAIAACLGDGPWRSTTGYLLAVGQVTFWLMGSISTT
jgi:hypothetical protein